jgi:molybdate transport system ATP-binding protein
MSLQAALHVRLPGFDLDVDLQVEPGEVLAILGPNGAGKTTLLRSITGLTPIDEGRLAVDGVVLDDPGLHVFVPVDERPIGMVFQSYLLFDHLSAAENVAFGLRARGMRKAAATARSTQWLARVGLADFAAARPRELSGGQAQRVALARALATEPRVLLLDEPLAALDVQTRREVRRDLRDHLASFDGMRLLVTHDPIDAYALASRVAILDAGRLVQTGTIAEVTAHPRSRYVAELVGTNLVSGNVDHGTLTTDSGTRVVVADAPNGRMFAVIRPQAVVLSNAEAAGSDGATSSARNSWLGTVSDIDILGDRARVSLVGALPLIAEVTVESVEALALRPGDAVQATVKATDIETYPA